MVVVECMAVMDMEWVRSNEDRGKICVIIIVDTASLALKQAGIDVCLTPSSLAEIDTCYL